MRIVRRRPPSAGGQSKRKPVALISAVALGVATVFVGSIVSSVVTAPALGDPSPIGSRPASAVTADALPTVQINGVVWTQVIVGNTVYAGGNFTSARPAGATAGTNTTPRSNLLAYNLMTGALITSFAPTVNSDVRTLAVSPDGSRLYIGGSFTSVNGVARSRVAAFNVATGALISNFAPIMSTQVNSIVATNTTVYVGGWFTSANGVARNRLAAFNASNGSLTAWDPNSDFNVNALALTPDGSRVIVGGSFQHVGGQPEYGLAAVDASSGAVLPWAANQSVQDAGNQAAIESLSTDGKAIYGTGYVFGAGGNLEGTFSADPDSGTINWVEDCHGDTYSNYSDGTTVYTVSHAHYCAPVGGYPQTDADWNINLHHALAFTAATTGTLGHNAYGGYKDWYGTPSPTMLNWFPDMKFGNYTAQGQAAWNVTGNGQYLVMGGEFPSVNGVAQQGLVRFAVPSIAPNAQGPMLKNSAYVPTLVSLSAGSVRVAFPANWDRDDQTLTYKVYRDGNTTTPVFTKTMNSQFWNRPMIGFTDTGLSPGSTHSYRVYVNDPSGNLIKGDSASITLPNGSPSSSAYAQDVLGDGASHYWRLGESSDTTAYDYAAYDDLTENSGVSHGAPGAIGSDPDTADTFDGSSSGFAVDPNLITGPNTFSEEAWFQTTSTSGGKIVSFGDQSSGNSSNYDRHIYMDPSGHVWFGVYNNGSYTVNTPGTYNDGQWHYVVGTMSSSGLVLYVDGKRIGTNGGTSVAQPYSGYWRIGGDSPWNGNGYFQGNIDDVAIYPTPLSLSQVQTHYEASGRSLNIPSAPTDSYGKAVWADTPDVWWRLDDASGPTAADASINGVTGTYSGGVNYRVPSTVTGPNGTGVTFDGSSGTLASSVAYQGPTTYSEELWFKTSTHNGGKLIGFGNAPSGTSSSYDRHVFMNGDGTLTFGTWTGSENEAISQQVYNDGQWHQMVATQGSDGMKLYVDGALVASNPQTQAQDYTGYWRVGGDTAWDGVQPWFAGSIDEAAVYLTELTPAQVAAHYHASPIAVNAPPTASFTDSATFLNASFDGSGSTDPDGTISDYVWEFGDGTSGSGATPAHSYATAGTYSVMLTVTDDHGAQDEVTHSITVSGKPNDPPTAAFTSSVNDLAVSFDGSGSSDDDGTIASYAWDFGDQSGTSTQAKPSYTYAAAGTYTVTLTVTDDKGATDQVSHSVTVSAANQKPQAVFSSSTSALTADFDATGSSDPDGTIASYSWDFGDNATGTGAKPSHTYAAAGTYQVKLTVSDNRGGTDSVTHSVSVAAANQAPTAAFDSSIANLTVAFDGSKSSDPDGSIASYAWDFGDHSGTSTVARPTHTYAAAGTYAVSLTVTDDKGATDTVTHSVTVTAGPTTYASDNFGRTSSSGWGNADFGGAWTLSGSASLFSVDGDQGAITLKTAGSGPAAYLNGVSQADVNIVADTSLSQLGNGGGVYTYLIARRSGTTMYRAKTWVWAAGAVQLIITKVVNGTETTLKSYTVPGLTYTAGTELRTRFTVKGSSPTTLTATVWKASGTEPGSPQISVTDSEPALQAAGSVGVTAYISASANTLPLAVKFDNFSVTAP